MATLLLVEDEETLAKNITIYLQRRGWVVEVAVTVADALNRIAEVGPDTILLDYNLPDMNGLEALPLLRERDPLARIVMMTGHANVQLAVDAMKAGTSDFISKPIVLADLARVLDKLVKVDRLSKEVAYYHSRDAGGLDLLLGECAQIVELKDRVRRVVQMKSIEGGPPPSILITGETGSGKELVARASHYESPRRGGPFIELNCAAIPANLLESELFGHERGAFTDARERKIGLVEAADGGTLFLDEVAEADLAIQAKLLKVIEDQRFRRLGSVQERSVDVRVVAATNQHLEQRAKDGLFRPDLLYRLRVIHLSLPPLRARGADVLLLARRFLDQLGRRYGRPAMTFTPAALDALAAYSWPGNVRELRNFIEQTVLLARHDCIDAADLSLPKVVLETKEVELNAAGGIELASVEQDLIRQALDKSAWNITQAAQMLGISRDTLRYRIEKYRLTRQTG
jgi:two-component system, NtrC family, response regulator AtoC